MNKADPTAVAASAPASADSPQDVANPTDSDASQPVGIARGLQFRHDERYEVEGDAEVVIKNGAMGTTLLRGSILDISSSGCYIRTLARVPIQPGTEVQIIFSVYGTTFRVTATSRFSKTKVGIGFRFIEMNESTRQKLYAVLADIRSRLIGSDPGGSLPVVERKEMDSEE